MSELGQFLGWVLAETYRCRPFLGVVERYRSGIASTSAASSSRVSVVTLWTRLKLPAPLMAGVGMSVSTTVADARNTMPTITGRFT